MLCLASGGGQQGPLLAAAGAKVTVFDNSPRQLGQDILVAERENLSLEVVEGDATDLSKFADETFGLIFHPCSNSFMQSIRPIWRECFRVLRAGGVLLAGFTNPLRYIFDRDQMEVGSFEVRWSIPYSDLDDLSEADLKKTILDKKEPFEFGHSLDDQIGGQLDAGFVLAAFYEDRYSDLDADPLSRYINTFLATRAIKPPSMAGSSGHELRYLGVPAVQACTNLIGRNTNLRNSRRKTAQSDPLRPPPIQNCTIAIRPPTSLPHIIFPNR